MIDDQFQTPIECCRYMTSMVLQGTRILEPTPGKGNLVKCLKERFPDVVSPKDFWELEEYVFDAIVMNPPFTPMKVGYDILYKCMDMTNEVVALMPWLTIINGEKRTKKILEYGLKSVTHLPRTMFPGARIQACILHLVKGFDSKTEFRFYSKLKE